MRNIFDEFGNKIGEIDMGGGCGFVFIPFFWVWDAILSAFRAIPVMFILLFEIVLGICGQILDHIRWMRDLILAAVVAGKEGKPVKAIFLSFVAFSVVFLIAACCTIALLVTTHLDTTGRIIGAMILQGSSANDRQVVSPANSGGIQGAATIAECAGDPTLRLKIGQNAKVNGANNNAPNILRSGPGKDNRRLASMPTGTSLKVLDGPVCASSYWYWKVQTKYGIGWTAEGDSSGYWLEPMTDNR